MAGAIGVCEGNFHLIYGYHDFLYLRAIYLAVISEANEVIWSLYCFAFTLWEGHACFQWLHTGFICFWSRGANEDQVKFYKEADDKNPTSRVLHGLQPAVSFSGLIARAAQNRAVILFLDSGDVVGCRDLRDNGGGGYFGFSYVNFIPLWASFQHTKLKSRNHHFIIGLIHQWNQTFEWESLFLPYSIPDSFHYPFHSYLEPFKQTKHYLRVYGVTHQWLNLS